MANTRLEGEVVMGSKDISSTNYADLHLQSVRKLHISIEVLDKDLNPLDTIQGISTGGSINVSNSSLIRRTGSLSFVLLDTLLPKKGSLLWMTNKIRVYAGIEDLRALGESITHFCLGTFFITEPSIDISPDNRSIGIELQDNMMRWEQEELETKLVIEAGTPLNTAVASVLNLFGEWNTKIDFTDLIVPYKLEFNEGQNVMEIIQKLRDLYMDWEAFYDVDGTFIFRKMNIQRENGEPIAWKFDDESNHITSFKESFSYKNVKNKIIVIGQMDDTTGLTPKAEATIADATSPFHENEIKLRKKVIVDTSYGTVEQCDARARYELFKTSNFQEKITIGALPIYFLDGNDIIEVRNFATKELEAYVIDSISIGLSVDGDMNISAHKLYYDTIAVDSTLADARRVADIVIDGIMNKGWLSLAEKRVLDYYGLAGTGNRLIVRFEKGTQFGATAYTTGYLNDKTQTLTIDVADFDSVGDSGDTGTGKGDYSDRILGHEVVHVIMNDVFGVSKTIDIPDWFKEGSAEFIHGADERLKLSIVESGAIVDTKLQAIIDSAKSMMQANTWNGISDSYSASYLAFKYLDRKLEGNLLKNPRFFAGNYTGWVNWGAPPIRQVVDITDLTGIPKAIKITTDNANQGIYQTIPVELGVQYTVSYWVKAESGQGHGMVNNNGSWLNTGYSDGNQWIKREYKFTANTTSLTFYAGRGAGGISGTYYFADIRIKKTSNKTMKDVMNSIKVSTKNGLDAMKDAITANLGLATFDDFVNDFHANAMNYVKSEIVLNLSGDEQDTGSIGGSDHREIQSYNAESVFDNDTSAIAGMALLNFVVEFNRP